MLEIEYIHHYLDRHYGVTLDGEYTLLYKQYFKNGKRLTKSEVLTEVENVFGFKDSANIAESWFYNERKKLAFDVNKFLTQYRVELSRVDWIVVDARGKELTCNDLCKALLPYYDLDSIIESYYEKWKENKIVETCEKMMGI